MIALMLYKFLYFIGDLGWFVIGDFNEVLFPLDKLGGSPRLASQMDSFCQAIDTYQFRPVSFFGLQVYLE